MIEISKLGIIGNCRSAALISSDGSIIWSCLPDFDSPSVFAKILDEKIGGEMGIIPESGSVITQSYISRTNVLRTLFETPSGSFEMLDFMPIYPAKGGRIDPPPEIYRLLRVIKGNPVIRVNYSPKLNYAKFPTRSAMHKDYIKSITVKGDYHSIYLYTNFAHSDILEGNQIELHEDSFFLINYHQKLVKVDLDVVLQELEKTKAYWTNWVRRTRIYPLYQKEIIRSALTLKLLTYKKTGAVIASVTASLPEKIGESRNWDYRYCWLRDASMVIQILQKICHKNTAREFLRFLLNAIIHKADKLQILYGIRGEKKLFEKKLSHLKGYKNSRPVRIGNAAYSQKQNDVYGVLMDLIYSGFVDFPGSIGEREELWTTVRFIMKTVEENWSKPDRGIWEIRKERKHFVFSKVLCWVAADRGVKIAKLLKCKDYENYWAGIRDAIRADIESKGWNPDLRSYTQSYGSADMDTALLLMENVGYCSSFNPRYISTVKAIYRDLCRNGLMYRYKNSDGFGKPGSAFIVCTFWMVDSLYKTGQKKKARDLFDKLLSYANHLGLFSEAIDFETRELLGNFPLGYSHLALINTAALLNGKARKKNLSRFKKP